MKISIGSDHAGFELKQYLFHKLKADGYEIIDCGVEKEVSVDYPDYALKVCEMVVSKKVTYGILICGSGIGISISANKINGIRAALCHNEYTAWMARQHNNANVLALGGRVIGKGLALEITRIFINEAFSKEERHQKRIDKMMRLEANGQ